MSKTQIETPVTAYKLRLSIVALLVVSSIIFYYFADTSSFFSVLGMIIILVVATGVFFTTPQGQAASSFLKASRIELRKMIWPTRVETLQTTLIVFVVVFIVALFLWGIDMLLRWGMRYLI